MKFGGTLFSDKPRSVVECHWNLEQKNHGTSVFAMDSSHISAIE